MSLLKQHKELIEATQELEGKLTDIGKYQFELNREAYFSVFPEEKDKQVTKADYFNDKIGDFRINEYGKCEAWIRGHWGGSEERVYEFEIDESLSDLSNHTTYLESRVAVYKLEKAARVQEDAEQLKRLCDSLEAQIAAVKLKIKQ